jgi:hypothetical protein
MNDYVRKLLSIPHDMAKSKQVIKDDHEKLLEMMKQNPQGMTDTSSPDAIQTQQGTLSDNVNRGGMGV